MVATVGIVILCEEEKGFGGLQSESTFDQCHCPLPCEPGMAINRNLRDMCPFGSFIFIIDCLSHNQALLSLTSEEIFRMQSFEVPVDTVSARSLAVAAFPLHLKT